MFDGGWPMRQFSCPPLLAPRYQKRAPRRREGREGTADEGWRMFDGGSRTGLFPCSLLLAPRYEEIDHGIHGKHGRMVNVGAPRDRR